MSNESNTIIINNSTAAEINKQLAALDNKPVKINVNPIVLTREKTQVEIDKEKNQKAEAAKYEVKL